MTIGLGEALAPGDAQGLPHDGKGDGGATLLRPDGKPFKLREIAEEPQPQAGGRLATDKAQQVHAAEIVSVEFLVVWTLLSAHVDDGADGSGTLEIIQRAHDDDGFRGRDGGRRDHQRVPRKRLISYI
jgi:hypothetical protein